ncbi:hypothetical protein HYS50_00185 [Candidatus Woesearchaeota archaeon]|nr:hypothetical protein [Candidatus Woesearchaeota archaeon]
MYKTTSMYGQEQAKYKMPTTKYSTANYQSPRRKTTRYLGCTCGGNSPCRGTCRTFFTE